MIVFCQNNTLVVGEILQNNPQREMYEQQAPKTIGEAIDQLIHGEKEIVMPQVSDAQLIAYMKENLVWVEAAGGAVRNKESKWLLIYRNGMWDLPKGKVEPGEDFETAALREVAEETGLRHHQIERHIDDTYHLYNTYGPWTTKRTHWFAMHTDEDSATTPQTEEGITRAEWFTYKELPELMKKAYPSITHVFHKLQFQNSRNNEL